MNEKYIERPKKFDKVAYNKEHYASFNLKINPDLKNEIESYCKDFGISKPEFLRRAIDVLKNQ